MMQSIIKQHFTDSINTKLSTLENCIDAISHASEKLINCLINGNKILCCGNGGSASDAQHFAAELLVRFERERSSLPAISLAADSSVLTAISNDYDYSKVFARQVYGLGIDNDILLAISTSGNSINVLNAITTAHQKNMQIIALTGNNGGKIASLLKNTDINICVPSKITCRIQETHIVILHCLCDLIDNRLFPNAN